MGQQASPSESTPSPITAELRRDAAEPKYQDGDEIRESRDIEQGVKEAEENDVLGLDGDARPGSSGGAIRKKRNKKKKGPSGAAAKEEDVEEDTPDTFENETEVHEAVEAAAVTKNKKKKKKKVGQGNSGQAETEGEGSSTIKDGGDEDAAEAVAGEDHAGATAKTSKISIISVETMEHSFFESNKQAKIVVSLKNVEVLKKVLFTDSHHFAIVFTSNSRLFQKAHAKLGAQRDSLYQWRVTTAGPYFSSRADFTVQGKSLVIVLNKMFYMFDSFVLPANMWKQLEEKKEWVAERGATRAVTPGSEDGESEGKTASKHAKGRGKSKHKHAGGKNGRRESSASGAEGALPIEDAALQRAEEGLLPEEQVSAGDDPAGVQENSLASDMLSTTDAEQAVEVPLETRRELSANAAEERRRSSLQRGFPHVTETTVGKARATLKVARGTTGLDNLGNTCFMNSVIQSLAHAPEIYRYFATDTYVTDINPDNPLGMQGELARAFGSLLKELWAGTARVVGPVHFKQIIGKFAKQFMGRQQHDAQEFLGFLLDGLHEDLNKVTNKPYIEAKDTKGRADIEVSREQWDNHKARNDSAIDDLFQGQYRSVVRCGECDEDSVTFDPFMYLSLPIPPGHRVIEVTVVLRPPNLRKLCRVRVPDMGHISKLRVAVAEAMHLAPEQLVFAEIWQHKFHRLLPDSERIESISPGDVIYAYEIDPPSLEDPVYVMHVVQRAIRAAVPQFCFKCSDKLKPLAQPMHIAGVLGAQPCGRCYRVWFCSTGCRQDETAAKLHEKNCQPAYENSIDDPLLISVNKSAIPEGGVTYAELRRLALDRIRPKLKQEIAQEVRPEVMFKTIRLAQDAHDHRAAVKGEDDQLDLLRLEWQGIAPHTHAGPELYLDWLPGERDGSLVMERYPYPPALMASPAAPVEMMVVTSPEAATALQEGKGGFEEPAQAADLHKCLQLYAEEETLDADDAWYCPKCRKHQVATKTLTLWRLPPLLVVHLKRFSYTRVHRHKIDVNVDYPLEGLDLAPYMRPSDEAHGCGEQAGKYMYDLFAVVEHHGALGGGHYTAHALNELPLESELDEGIGSDQEGGSDSGTTHNKWYLFNDRTVTPAKPADAKNSAAYVLFYRRRDAQS